MSISWSDFFLADPYEGAKAVEDDLQGWGSDDPMFEQVIAKILPRTIIEVGSWKGRSAVNIVNTCLRYGVHPSLVCVIGDAHDSPHLPNKERFYWLGRFAAEHNVDWVVSVGDWMTMDCFSSFNDRATFEGFSKAHYFTKNLALLI